MEKSCTNCRHRLRLGKPEEAHWFCRWLDSVLPPPLVYAIESTFPATQEEIEPDELDQAETCPCYEHAE
jgi:hypothetical protein